MKKGLIIGIFSCVALIQIATPLSMILKRESVLQHGEQFKFKTAPVDPYDAFRGRYVALRIEADTIPKPKGLDLMYGQTVYAHIVLDEQGFAKFSTVTASRPKDVPYIQAKAQSAYTKDLVLDLPIDRYYMEEKSAPVAEGIYRQQSRQDKQDAYLLVRIRDGFPVIEAFYVGGKRIEEAVRDAKRRGN